MKHKKWLFPILSAVVASVAVVAVWINIESRDRGDHKVLKSPKITYVSAAAEEPSRETVKKGPRITYVSAAAEEPSGETVKKGPRITRVSVKAEEPEEVLIQEAHFIFAGSSIEELTAEADVIVRELYT